MKDFVFLLPIVVFVFTLILVIVRPKYLGIGYSACLGALIVYLFGFVTNQDVVDVVRLTWNATFAFVALVVICFVLDEIGLFEWAALKMIQSSRKSPLRLFVNLILLGAGVSALFANDGAALIVTPLVIAKVKLLKIPADKILPFVIAGGFIADTASLPLVTSNLVNIVAADFFEISYAQYAKYMSIPFMVSVAVSLLMLYLLYQKSLKKTLSHSWEFNEKQPIYSEFSFFLSLILIGLMFVGCFIGGAFRVPVSFFLVPTAIILSIVAFVKRVTTAKKIYKATPFSIIFFALGMFLVIMSLKSIGLIDLLARILNACLSLGHLVGTLLTGLLASVLSCFVNNLPAVMVSSLAISHLDLTLLQQKLLVFANIIGCDVGPKMFPMGSLATLLWLHLLEKQNIKISYWYFIRVGVFLTVPTLFLTLTSLYLWALLF